MSKADVPQRISSIALPLKLFVTLQILLVLACELTEAFCKFVMHLPPPYTYPLKTVSQTDWDFTLFTNKFQHFGHPDFFRIEPDLPVCYPAPVDVAYKIFFSYHAHPLRFFLGFIIAAFLFAGLLLGVALCRRGVSSVQSAFFIIATLLMSYPLWFELKQGNIEIVIWVLVAIGVWAFCKGKGYTAAACFGIAGSMKIFPFIYLGLLLNQRKYREMVFSAFTAACSTLISLRLMSPDILQSWRYISNSLTYFRITYLLHFRGDEIGFDHTLFGIYKRFSHHLPPPEQLGHIVNIYLAIAAVCGIALYFLKIRYLPLINQVLCLTIASILLPPISYEYTLMHLYIPWAMLVLFAQEQSSTGSQMRRVLPGLTATFICFAILFSPMSELIHHVTRYGGQIKALVLVVLMTIGLRYPFPSQDSLKTGTPLAT